MLFLLKQSYPKIVVRYTAKISAIFKTNHRSGKSAMWSTEDIPSLPEEEDNDKNPQIK